MALFLGGCHRNVTFSSKMDPLEREGNNMPICNKNTFTDTLKTGILKSTCAVLSANYENCIYKSELPDLQEEDRKNVTQVYCF